MQVIDQSGALAEHAVSIPPVHSRLFGLSNSGCGLSMGDSCPPSRTWWEVESLAQLVFGGKLRRPCVPHPLAEPRTQTIRGSGSHDQSVSAGIRTGLASGHDGGSSLHADCHLDIVAGSPCAGTGI